VAAGTVKGESIEKALAASLAKTPEPKAAPGPKKK
jgi:hypothetical protein